MKLLVSGEGVTELGRPGQAGIIDTIVRRCLDDDARRLIAFDNHRYSPMRREGRGDTPRAENALAEARRRDCDGVIIVRDADRDADARRVHLEAACRRHDIPWVVGVAIETIEAWVLADEAAVRMVLSRSVELPERPEALWGPPGKAGHPKHEWENLCRQARITPALATKAAVLDRALLSTLREKCPRGFAPFHDALTTAFPPFDLVIAVDRAGGIGRDQGLPWPKLKADLAHFKALTSTAAAGKRNAIVMGRKTFESKEVARRALPRRLSVVISRSPQALPEGVLGARSLTEALFRARQVEDIDQVFVVGGAEIYRHALAHPRLRHAYVTRVDGDFGCDTVVPDLDATMTADASWAGAGAHEDNGVRYRIERLARPA